MMVEGCWTSGLGWLRLGGDPNASRRGSGVGKDGGETSILAATGH